MSARPAPRRWAWLAPATPARRRLHLVLAVGLVALGISLAAASVPRPAPPTPSEVPLSSPPVGQLDITGNWTDATDQTAGERLFVHIGTTAGYVATGKTTDLCVHVADDSNLGVEGAAVEFEASSGTLESPRATTDATGRACTDFAAPDAPGQVIVSANVTHGSLAARTWNTVEVIRGPAASGGVDAGLFLAGASAALLGMTLLAVSTAPLSAKQRRLRAGSLLLASALVLAMAALAADLPGTAAPEGADPHGHGAAALEEEPLFDVPLLAAGLVGLGTIAFAAGMGLRTRPTTRPGGTTLLVALALLYLDGAVHWLAVGEHAGVLLHQVFFLAVGGLQVAVAVAGTRSVRLLWCVGVPFTLLLAALYVGTRVVAPVVPALLAYAEPLDALGLVSKGAEAGLLVCLSLAYRRFGTKLVGRASTAPRRVRPRDLAGAIARTLKIP